MSDPVATVGAVTAPAGAGGGAGARQDLRRGGKQEQKDYLYEDDP